MTSMPKLHKFLSTSADAALWQLILLGIHKFTKEVKEKLSLKIHNSKHTAALPLFGQQILIPCPWLGDAFHQRQFTGEKFFVQGKDYFHNTYASFKIKVCYLKKKIKCLKKLIPKPWKIILTFIENYLLKSLFKQLTSINMNYLETRNLQNGVLI